MALFNKLFLGLKSPIQNSNEDSNVSQKTFDFSTENVRIVLFRECDFRGRKLLFDSNATEKVLMEKAEQEVKFVEISNGYGYLVISKQNCDYPQLSEMIFGSIAMSFRGTYFKIHSLNEPTRLMFTQVFPSPNGRRKNSSPTSSCQSRFSTRSSFEHSIKLDDSEASSNFSTSDRLSDRSTASDTVLVCRRLQSSPLDVPRVTSSSKNSLVVDSGCADQSFPSYSTGPLTFPTWETIFSHKGVSSTSISSCSIFKRLFRSSSRSLQNSTISLPNSGELLHKNHHRTSKLGLAIVVQIPSEKERFLIQLFMEHIALLEALIWRTRHAIENAYHRPSTFISSMMDITQSTALWIVNLLNAPRTLINLWQCLFLNCDNQTSISAFNSELKCPANLNIIKSSDNSSDLRSFCGLPFKSRTEIFNFKFLRTDMDRNKNRHNDKGLIVDEFLREFCDLLEELDVKETNFFMSTLLTAVLTHHLGWVATVLPASASDNEAFRNFRQPYNALWDQLTDLYGAIGHPVKTAQTVVTGTNKNNIISKILNSLTYFIRFSNIERRHIERVNIDEENLVAEKICIRNNCIPNEYYKRYEDHLKEMLTEESQIPCCSKEVSKNEIESKTVKKCELILDSKDVNKIEVNKTKCASSGLSKSKTQDNLSTLISRDSGDHLIYQSDVNKSTHLYPFSNQNKICKDNDKSEVSVSGLKKIKTQEKLSKFVETETTECLPETPNILGMSRVSSSLGDVLQTHFFNGKSGSDFKKVDERNKDGFPINELKIKALTKSSNVEDFSKLENKTEYETTCDCDANKIFMETSCDKSNVLFVLGDDEQLVGLKKDENCSSLACCSKATTAFDIAPGAKRKTSTLKRPSSLNLTKENYNFTSTAESNILESNKMQSTILVQSSSYESLCPDTKELSVTKHSELTPHLRAQSEPPVLRKLPSTSYPYSRVKFNLQQYPQVVKNYMKSKNIELEGLSLGDKAFEKFATVQNNIKLDFSGYESDSEEVEALHTPSNASELLEFTNDVCDEIPREDSKEASSLSRTENMCKLMKLVNIPMPQNIIKDDPENMIPYTSTVLKGLVENYIPDMVLQGLTNPKQLCDSNLKNNLAINTQHSLLDQPVEESLAIVANIDTWDVQIMSSQTYVIDKGTNGVRVGMSQLVANLLESLLNMWKLHIPAQHCILHIEQRLQELCVQSKALAQLLLASEFCSMEMLTSTLRIGVNDVPLLMAVASTHTPEVTRKYGLSFQ